ncbi:hypothetical protein TARUN_6252 [Trichoderma arundinaceum]|uniref:Uncharacterized protein n=1 Tax=Trichoderma arundinaceum TaxID=490622 RepID=A0A395NJI4_TRIAR|nr:hypothetical protein TARUN_6252 [Trichoderma arundinaceum]
MAEASSLFPLVFVIGEPRKEESRPCQTKGERLVERAEQRNRNWSDSSKLEARIDAEFGDGEVRVEGGEQVKVCKMPGIEAGRRRDDGNSKREREKGEEEGEKKDEKNLFLGRNQATPPAAAVLPRAPTTGQAQGSPGDGDPPSRPNLPWEWSSRGCGWDADTDTDARRPLKGPADPPASS